MEHGERATLERLREPGKVVNIDSVLKGRGVIEKRVRKSVKRVPG